MFGTIGYDGVIESGLTLIMSQTEIYTNKKGGLWIVDSMNV